MILLLIHLKNSIAQKKKTLICKKTKKNKIILNELVILNIIHFCEKNNKYFITFSQTFLYDNPKLTIFLKPSNKQYWTLNKIKKNLKYTGSYYFFLTPYGITTHKNILNNFFCGGFLLFSINF